MELHLAIDDTDSPLGQCTTYITYLLAKRIAEEDLARFLDYPNLVRLNPNIPFKTRGNAATALHLETTPEKAERIEGLARRLLEENAESHGKTSPILAVIRGGIPRALRTVYERALREFLPRRYLSTLVENGFFGRLEVWPGTGNRGLVGALAALGAYPLREYTYELLVYRDPRDRGPRNVPEDLLISLDRRYRPVLFTTYDYSTRRPLAVPHGPDPVVLGLRSFDPRILLEAARLLLERLPYRRYMIYRTNQATNAHLTQYKEAARIRPYDSVIVKGRVSRGPEIMPGGHVRLVVSDGTGEVQVMVYRETGRLNRLARLLVRGDLVEIGGGVVPRKGLTLNAEQIRLLKTAPFREVRNPRCPRCGATMKSAGRGKGYKCPKCGYRTRSAVKIVVEKPRIVEPGLYVSSPRAYRHLTRPVETYGIRPVRVFLKEWIS